MLGYLCKEDPTRKSKIEYKHYSSFENTILATRSSDNSSLGWGATGSLVLLPTGRLVSPKSRKKMISYLFPRARKVTLSFVYVNDFPTFPITPVLDDEQKFQNKKCS